MTAIAPPSRRWVFGPVPDLLLGCGLGYALLIAVVPWLSLDATTLTATGLLASLFIGAPHYGATLLRVYGHRRDRRKYAFFAIYASAIVWLAFVFGLYDLRIGSALITLYFTWSPWHYTGQNYGISVMFLRRAGVAIAPGAKRLLYASFALSFVLAFLTMHQAAGTTSYGVGSFMGTRYRFLHLGLPPALLDGAFSVTAAAYLGTTLAALAWLRRDGARAADLLPVCALVVTQALWFSVPHLWAWWTGTLLEQRSVAFLFVWAVLGHSVQYLWVTTWYAAGRGGARERARYLAATLAAGAAIWTLPALLFAPGLLGTLPYDMGLFLMIAAAVNVQHFVLDGAIWKLRDSGVGRILLAVDDSVPEGDDDRTLRTPWARGAAWVVGAGCIALATFGAWQQIALRSAYERGDAEALRSAHARLAAIGRDDPRYHAQRAGELAARGESQAAIDAYRRSLDLLPTAHAWLGLGALLEQLGRTDEALAAYRNALALDPGEGRAYHRIGVLLLLREKPRAALEALRQAARLRPDDARVSADLARAIVSSGRAGAGGS